MKGRCVVVGAGQAGVQAVTSLRQEGFSGEIVLIGDEPHAPYQRPPLSKKYLTGEITADRLLLKSDAFYAAQSIDLRLSARVAAIDRASSRIILENGVPLGYDTLILATGARARRMPALDAGTPGVFYLRQAGDVDILRPALAPGKRLLVVGGGYIGLEVAAVARLLGLDVDLVEYAPRLLARVAGPRVSGFFLDLHVERGVHVHLGVAVEAALLTPRGHVRGVRLVDGREIEADFVLVGVGAVPNTELAEAAGLAIDNGVSTDAGGRTSDPVIFAAGDCASHPSRVFGRRLRLESVPNAIEQARSCAASICGKDKPYDQVPWFWSDQYDVKFQAAGLLDGYEDTETARTGDAAFAVTYFRAGRPIAVEAVNAPALFMKGRAAIAAAAA